MQGQIRYLISAALLLVGFSCSDAFCAEGGAIPDSSLKMAPIADRDDSDEVSKSGDPANSDPVPLRKTIPPRKSAAGAEDTEKPFQLQVEKRNKGEKKKSMIRVPQILRLNAGRTEMPTGLLEPREDDDPLTAAAKDVLKASASVRALANFDLELIVDESKSMQHRDCPGDLSRWEWCGKELAHLSRQLSPYVPRGFTLTTFSAEYNVCENATPRNVIERFNNPSFDLGTRLSLPLNDRFGHYFAVRKPDSRPVLMVIITDGVPHPSTEPFRVIDSLVSASRRVGNNKELTVVFFQIGGKNKFGREFVKQLDDDLISYGARYDLVRSLPFSELERVGLLEALVSLVRDFSAKAENKLSPSQSEGD